MAPHPLIMGILNITPDSFSDGGRFVDHAGAGDTDAVDHAAAIEHGLALIAEGADLIDIGGESTRPGAEPVATETEMARVLPVIEALVPHTRVSVDTLKPEVARAAVDAGATLINDVGGELWPVAAELGVPWVAMHSRGTPATMQQLTHYDDVVAEVTAKLVVMAEKALAAGVPEVWIDPGIGFAKTPAHNIELLAHLETLVATGYPVLIGTSRKMFLGRAHARSDAQGWARAQASTRSGVTLAAPNLSDPTMVPPGDRVEGSVATVVWSLAKGARMVRVHDVRPALDAAMVVGS